jgi:phosphoribosylamine--glycine ligase
VVLEFNARFGDPEAQALLPLLDVDPVEICLAAASGSLAGLAPIPTLTQSAVAVVLTSSGYPGPFKTGLPIAGLNDLPDDVLPFHGATRRDETGRLVTGGGRVLTVVGLGDSPDAAHAKAYAGVNAIGFDGAHFRRDIGN